MGMKTRQVSDEQCARLHMNWRSRRKGRDIEETVWRAGAGRDEHSSLHFNIRSTPFARRHSLVLVDLCCRLRVGGERSQHAVTTEEQRQTQRAHGVQRREHVAREPEPRVQSEHSCAREHTVIGQYEYVTRVNSVSSYLRHQ